MLNILGRDLPINLPSKGAAWAQLKSWHDDRHAFPTALDPWTGWPITLRERAMISFMGEIAEKPEWQRKVCDKEIVQKWRTERSDLETAIEASGKDHGFSEKMFDNVSMRCP